MKTNPPEVEIILPVPYGLQREIMDSPAKRKVICAGRRGGKTVMAGLIAIEDFFEGKRVLLSSTSQDQSDVFWDYIVTWLSPLVDAGVLYKNEVKRIVRLGSGQIQVKTGRHPDALRGGDADLLVLDECAYLDPDAWRKVGAPMLADRDGTAVFISTPKRRNWFFELYQHAIAGMDERWQGWQFSTLQNPHLSQTALQALVSDMTQEDYQQEILAQFLEGQGAVFRYVDDRCTALPQKPYKGNFVMGADWGKSQDFTVIVVMDADTRTVVAYDRFNQVDWTLQRGKLRTLYEAWKPKRIIAEQNSFGDPNIDALQREGLPVTAFNTTAASKPPLIESLVLAFDRAEITVLNDPVMKGELMAYERKVSSTGRSQYSAPDGLHDDTVMALALAWYGITNTNEVRQITGLGLRDYRG